MVRNTSGRPASPWRPIVTGFAAVLVAGGIAWSLFIPDWRGALAVAAVAAAVLVAATWRSRARAARKWEAALAIYAEREIAKARRNDSRQGAGRRSRAGKALSREVVYRQ
jgi:hypothetical protein